MIFLHAIKKKKSHPEMKKRDESRGSSSAQYSVGTRVRDPAWIETLIKKGSEEEKKEAGQAGRKILWVAFSISKAKQVGPWVLCGEVAGSWYHRINDCDRKGSDKSTLTVIPYDVKEASEKAYAVA